MSLRIDSKQQTESLTRKTGLPNKSELDFGQSLNQVQKLHAQELQKFLVRLEEKGQRLAKSLSLQDLIDFRDMVKTFLRSTFGLSRRVQEESFWDFRGRPKILARINHIDKALEELGQKVLDNQAKPLQILEKIDEIKGLIVDLFG